MLAPLKNWAAHLFHDKFLCYQVTDENTMPVVKNQQKIMRKKLTNISPKITYLSQYDVKEMHLPAGLETVMQNQYFVNVPVYGNIFVKKRKNKKLRNPTESGKRTQQPLQNHTSQSNNPPCEKRQLSPTGDDVHVHVPTVNHFKKPKYELTTNS